MGYNTALLILNDSLDIIKKNPVEFTDKVCEKIAKQEGGSISVGNHCNPVQVVKTQHADVMRVYVSHGNWLAELTYWSDDIERARSNKHLRDELKRRCAEAKYQANRTLETLDAMGDSDG